jgi:hypothetical protein
MPNKNCQSCADKIIKMRELKRLRKLKEELLNTINTNNWKTNITHSDIKGIIKKCKRFSLKENGA